MVAVIFSLTVVAGFLGMMLAIDRLGWFSAEARRKFFHISAGSFAAFWPWLMSFKTIEVLGLAMLAGVWVNHYHKVFDFAKGIRRKTYGVAFSALGIYATAFLSKSKVIFAMALLCVALADGLAALIGSQAGKRWRYKVFGQTKTVIGTMTFWVVSLFVLGIGLPFVPAHHYIPLLIFLPPLLAFTENIAIGGLDNLAVPVVLVLVLRAVG